MSEQAARQRMAAQPPQQEKLARADVVIHNDETFEVDLEPGAGGLGDGAAARRRPRPRRARAARPSVRRGRPPDADEIAGIHQPRAAADAIAELRADIMAAFGQKAYFLLELNGEIIGLIGWQVDNLVTRADEVLILPAVDAREGPAAAAARHGARFLRAAERGRPDLRDRALARSPSGRGRLRSHGQGRLSIRAWEEAAREAFVPDAQLFSKAAPRPGDEADMRRAREWAHAIRAWWPGACWRQLWAQWLPTTRAGSG